MDGSREQRATLDAQLCRVRALEETDLYREMCAAADERNRSQSALPKDGVGRPVEPTPAEAAYRARGRTHGLIATYQNGCRCDECRAGAAKARATARAKYKAKAPAKAPASAAAAGSGFPSAVGDRPAAAAEAQGRSPGSAAVQAPPTSEAGA